MKTKTIIFSVAAAVVTVGVIVGGVYGWLPAAIAVNQRKHTVKTESFAAGQGADRIHFMNTGSSDAILIESNGRFALIDAAEDTEYPKDKPDLKTRGYEQEVIAYLKKVAGDKNGKVTLDFVLGTHAHSDHIGGFDTVAAHPDITIAKAYLKEYRPDRIRKSEITDWDNQEVYDQMVSALKARGTPVLSELPDAPFVLGDFTIQFFNTGYETQRTDIGENDNAVGTLVSKGQKKAFLAADMDNLTGDEDRVGPMVGKVDLLKVGHHGYENSTSKNFVKALDPDIAILTNNQHWAHGQVRRDLTVSAGASIYATVQNNGLIATFEDDGQITLAKNACDGIVKE